MLNLDAGATTRVAVDHLRLSMLIVSMYRHEDLLFFCMCGVREHFHGTFGALHGAVASKSFPISYKVGRLHAGPGYTGHCHI
jgi:hypothetical protein